MEMFLLEILLTLDIDLPLLNIMNSANIPICRVKNVLFILNILYSIASDQVTHFTTREMQLWAHDYEIHWSFFNHPEEVVLL